MILKDVEHLKDLCKRYDRLFIYGAGKNASYLYRFFKSQDLAVNGFVISDRNKNPDLLFGLPVIGAEELHGNERLLVITSITKSYGIYNSVFDHIVGKGLKNVVFLSFETINKIRTEVDKQELEEILDEGLYHPGTNIPVEIGHHILAMTGINGEEYHWRFKADMIVKQNIPKICELFPQKTALEEFEGLYGQYHILHNLKTTDRNDHKTIVVYMAQHHADQQMPQRSLPKWIIPIQVGAVMAEKYVCDVRDNTGDHISDRNPIYSECTALYWMWKNAPATDYIGLCHYRRHFDMSEMDFTRLEGADMDVLVTAPTFVSEGVNTFFANFLPRADVDIFLKVIKDVCIQYLPDAEAFLDARFFPPCNLAIMKYGLFQKYMKFVFSITFEIERHYEELNFYRNDRYMGYLVEWLLGIFLMHHKGELKIAYTDMLFYQ